ncbi:MAG: hypothetical protein VBE63_13835 [Lamprobacter sp.]|uniref:hypothetical protein n=1 Tax=Lamprobacter sp. TaxID=3100796 RepID=UPI002B2592F9|nr:hypothetical protein [Lamprobacter sp.]MEA3641006.1 hypothetical protein [Lamprobacter sp.]
MLTGLARASFVEWRYFAVLSPAFQGIVGLALVNPERRFRQIAEGGLLLIVAGVIDRPRLPGSVADARGAGPLFGNETAELCWMHLFAPDACHFDRPGSGSSSGKVGAGATLRADDVHSCVELRQASAAEAQLQIEAGQGLKLRLSHRGLPGTGLPNAIDTGIDGWFGRALGAHWQVQCPAPMAWSDGELALEPSFLEGLAETAGGINPCYASAALRARVASGQSPVVAWRAAAGYAEHSLGIRPLPLQGWDFLFVPKPETNEALVLQTYPGSQALRYVEVCWPQDGALRQWRFPAESLRLDWPEQIRDPVLGVSRPLGRRIEAESGGLRLSLDNRVLHRIPLLRRQRLAVRHFFISEEIGIADWRLSDDAGQVLAEVKGQPCGGELAHRRLWVPPAV